MTIAKIAVMALAALVVIVAVDSTAEAKGKGFRVTAPKARTFKPPKPPRLKHAKTMRCKTAECREKHPSGEYHR